MDTTTEKRKNRRIGFRETVQFQTTDGSRYGGSVALDLSQGGLRLNLNDFFPLNTEFSFQFNLTPKEFVECMGKVVWIEKLPHAERYQVGVEFVGDESKFLSQDKIHKYIQPIYQHR